MARAALYQHNIEGGIDFNRIDYSTVAGVTASKFPVGCKAEDQQGQRWQYVQFNAQLTPAGGLGVDNVLSFPLQYTRTLSTLTNPPTQAENDAASSGLIDKIVAASAGAATIVDAFFPRRVIGDNVAQFNPAPTSTLPAFAWVKVKGLARQAPTAVAAGVAVSRTLTGSAFVATSGVANEKEAGIVITSGANGAGDIEVDLEG